MNRRVALAFLFGLLTVSFYVRSSDAIPRALTGDAFWRMVNAFSEEGGYFRFQFMSNEREFPSIVPELKKSVRPGGVYLGVGPEQNFTYITATQPRIAFIFDIRRQNMLEHLIYKALFETSASRAEFVSRLFSRKAPAGLPVTASARSLFHAFSSTRPDPQLYAANLQAIKDRLMRDHRFQLNSKDQSDIDGIYQTIFDAGPGIDYPGSFGGFRSGLSYAAMMTATDEHGDAWSYLANEENFQFLREMHRRNLIVPLVGDFAGPKAIRAVASYLKDRGGVVRMFYTSNVEQYLFQQGDDWRRYYANVATLPLDPSSVFLRSSHYSSGAAGQPHDQFTGMNYVMLLCPIAGLTKAFNAGGIRSYDDVIRMSY